MGKSNFVWGESSLSDDIFNNLSKTHHKEKIYENSFAHDFGQSMLNSKYKRPFKEVLVRNNNEDFVSEYGENHAYFDEDKRYKKSIERDYGNQSESYDNENDFEDFKNQDYCNQIYYEGKSKYEVDTFFHGECSTLYDEDVW